MADQQHAIIISDSIPEVEVIDSQDTMCDNTPSSIRPTIGDDLSLRLDSNVFDDEQEIPIIQEKTQSLINIDEVDLTTPISARVENINNNNLENNMENNDNKKENNEENNEEESILEKEEESKQDLESTTGEDVIMVDDSSAQSQQEDTGFETDEEEEEEESIQPSIIPDKTVSTCTINLDNDEEEEQGPTSSYSATTEMVNLLANKTPTLEVTPNTEKVPTRTFKKHTASDNTQTSAEKESNISISFTNVSHKLIEKIQKLLDEEYISFSKKGRKRESVTLCSGSIEANPLFATEKINFDASYLKNLKIDVEKPKIEDKPVNSNKICYNCLGVGHIIRDCPREIDYDQIELNKESFKSNDSRFYEAIDPRHTRTRDRNTAWNNALDMGDMAFKLSERTRRRLTPQELESYKCATPENKTHTKDVGKVSDEFLYGGALPADYSGRKEQLNKVFTKLKEHKESEKKRKSDQLDSGDEDEYINVNVSQHSSNNKKFNKNKKQKGSYSQSQNDRDYKTNRNNKNNNYNYKSNNRKYQDNDRYQDDDRYQEDRYDNRYNDNRRYDDDEDDYSQRSYSKDYSKDRKNKKNSNNKKYYSNNRR